jgi:hypothetical protein
VLASVGDKPWRMTVPPGYRFEAPKCFGAALSSGTITAS